MSKLEEKFTAELLQSLAEAERVTGVSETRLAEQAKEKGGAEAVRQLLDRGHTTRQFDALQKKKRLDLSVEALVTKGKYTELFTDDECNSCLNALLAGGLYG